MATIPGTKFTELAPPAETGQTFWSPTLASTGGEQVMTEGLKKMSRAITAYAINTMEQEMALEFSERERMIDELGWTARNSVTGNEEADKKLWEKFEQDARAIAGSSRYKKVNDNLTIHINRVSPNWEQGIYISSLNKRRENTKDEFLLEKDALLEKGLIPEANALAEKGYKLGIITQAEYDNFVKNAPIESRLLMAERMAELGNFTAALTEINMLNPEDLTTPQLKRRGDIQAQVEEIRKANSEAIEIEISNDIIKAMNNEVPPEQKLTYGQIRDKISQAAEQGKFTDASQVRELTHFLDSIVNNGGKSASENDPEALAEAYKIITTDKTQKQKFEKLMELKPKLKSITVDGFVKDIYEPETISNEIYKQYSSAITNLKTGKMFGRETTKNINLSVKAQELLRLFAKQNPDATEKEYEEFFNKLIENQTSWWAVGPGGKSFWNSFRREKGELRYSIPRNIEAMEKETTVPSKTAITKYKTGDKRTVNGVVYTYDGQYWKD